MPYYIYEIGGPLGRFAKQGVAKTFKEAKARVSELRGQADPASGVQVRMVFAENERAAEDALSRPRTLDPSLAGDDY